MGILEEIGSFEGGQVFKLPNLLFWILGRDFLSMIFRWFISYLVE